MWPRLVLNSWTQVICLPQPTKPKFQPGSLPHCSALRLPPPPSFAPSAAAKGDANRPGPIRAAVARAPRDFGSPGRQGNGLRCGLRAAGARLPRGGAAGQRPRHGEAARPQVSRSWAAGRGPNAPGLASTRRKGEGLGRGRPRGGRLPPDLSPSAAQGTAPPTPFDPAPCSETGFHLVGQAGLRLLTSSDLPASAYQSAGITGVSHRAQQPYFINQNTSCVGILLHDLSWNVVV
ncbi:Protein GVQW1 [Plecturocebus cupreus]